MKEETPQMPAYTTMSRVCNNAKVAGGDGIAGFNFMLGGSDYTAVKGSEPLLSGADLFQELNCMWNSNCESCLKNLTTNRFERDTCNQSAYFEAGMVSGPEFITKENANNLPPDWELAPPMYGASNLLAPSIHKTVAKATGAAQFGIWMDAVKVANSFLSNQFGQTPDAGELYLGKDATSRTNPRYSTPSNTPVSRVSILPNWPATAPVPPDQIQTTYWQLPVESFTVAGVTFDGKDNGCAMGADDATRGDFSGFKTYNKQLPSYSTNCYTDMGTPVIELPHAVYDKVRSSNATMGATLDIRMNGYQNTGTTISLPIAVLKQLIEIGWVVTSDSFVLGFPIALFYYTAYEYVDCGASGTCTWAPWNTSTDWQTKFNNAKVDTNAYLSFVSNESLEAAMELLASQ